MRFILTFACAMGVLFGQDAPKGKEVGKMTQEQVADLKLMEADFKTAQAELRAALAEKKVAEQAVTDASNRGQAIISRYQAKKVAICGGVNLPADQCDLNVADGTILKKTDPPKPAGSAKPEQPKSETSKEGAKE